MKNQFEILNARLLYLNKNIFYLKGIFSQNEMKESKIIVLLDGQRLPVKAESRQGTEIKQNYAWHPWTVDTEYLFFSNLPSDVRNKQVLSVLIMDGRSRKTVFCKSVGKLLEKKNKIAYSIDSVYAESDLTVMEGWVIWKEGMEIILKDSKGKELETKITYGYRRDVIKNYPEIKPDRIKGFKITAKGLDEHKIYLYIRTADREQIKECRLYKSAFGRVAKSTAILTKKVYLYYQRNGVFRTVAKVGYKLLNREEVDYEKWIKKHAPSKAMLEKQRKRIFEFNPKISIVVPLYKTPEKYLRELIGSIIDQSYSNWELCLSDGSGENSPIQPILMEYQKKDARIKVVYNEVQMQISDNTNKALELASGDYIAFADHDDLLAPNALYECVRVFNGNPKVQAVYTDEDKISMDGKKHFQPHFKPDFNRDLLNSTNYFCHLFVVQRKIVDTIGGLNSEFDGAQDYDFVLRCSEQMNHIYHIPKILYHWRAHMNSTAENPESKMYAFEAGVRAIKAHYDRIGLGNTKVTQTNCLGVYRTHYIVEEEPFVSIVIPNKDHVDDLNKCICSIKKQNYSNYEIIIVENNSTEEETFKNYDSLGKDGRINIVYWKDKFNFSAINNYGVQHSKGEYLLFLNNDTEMIGEDCLQELVGFAMRKDVGAVGARLYYDDNTIQHAGVIIGLGGIAGHIFQNTPSDQVGYFARIITQQDYSAVTAACVMTKREIFDAVEGFDEQLEVAFNDVDICLKIRRKGYVVVYNPYAELYHYESKSRGYDDTEGKVERLNRETALFEEKWGNILKKGDPYYNPNFAIDAFDCRLK